jgi:hypothetical protein
VLAGVVRLILDAEPPPGAGGWSYAPAPYAPPVPDAPPPAAPEQPATAPVVSDSAEAPSNYAIAIMASQKAELIDTLRRMRGKAFAGDVVRVARNALSADQKVDKGLNAALLLSCLRFIEVVRTAEGEALAEKLTSYPYRSEVRDAANKLLGRR